MTSTLLDAFDETVSVETLQNRVSRIKMRMGLQFLTALSSEEARGNANPRLANSFNLPLLAKAFVLWGAGEDGEDLTDEEGKWLLRAVNSLPWHSRLAAQLEGDEPTLRMIIRQGFQRFYYDDPLDARIARTWMMFVELVKEGNLEVPDPSAELEKLLGVSIKNLWAVGMMIRAYHAYETANDYRKWVFDPNAFVLEGENKEEITQILTQALLTIARQPKQLQEIYNAENSKYRNPDREGFWLSEFNILRDFPVVDVGGGRYCAPFPNFALTRVLDGFYFDLLNEFARRKRASGATDNAYDNEMCNTLGTLFEMYGGKQLGQLRDSNQHLRGEFEFGPKKNRRLSTDWILSRPGKLTVLFEFKARETVLDVQRFANIEDLRKEVEKALGKACRQLARFIRAIDNGDSGLEAYPANQEFICAVVLQAPLPFHMVRDIRQLIESVANRLEPSWRDLRNRINFVPMSIRELETAVATELTIGVDIEDQLIEYAAYREQVGRLEGFDGNGLPIFPRHLEEFLQQRYGDSKRISNPLCDVIWNRFCAFCQQQIFGEDIAVADQELVTITKELAYQLWEARGRPLGDDLNDWFTAESLISSGAYRISNGSN